MNAARFEAKVSRPRIVLLAVLGAGMTAMSGFVARSPAFADDGFAQLMGWIGLIFFALCVLAALRQLFRRGPVIEIGHEGVRWQRWSDETIPWSAFERADVAAIQRQWFLSLWLRDPARYRSTHLLGRLAGANKAMGFGDIALSVQDTDRRFDDMVAAVRTHAPQLFD